MDATFISSGETDSKKWQEAINTAIPAIVVIRVCSVRAFDGSGAGFSTATGFIVDKERGIILTNRHVVTPGPVRSDAIFLNKEEVDLVPIYRDPVHDFGFYKFDPSKLKFQTLHEIPLDPDGAWIGREIRVVGNDNGEKLSILPGVLARLDREAPFYGSNDYNDFNTFYYCAASSTSGGSSGSPVLTIEGKAIALNCGGAKKAASSFYLPVHRILRALQLIQVGDDGASPVVPRGTLQTIFKHAAFDEVRRLGLPEEIEKEVREASPKETGMLVVDQVIPKGPADTILEAGDVLLRLNGKHITQFKPYEELLDESVGQEVELTVQRGTEVKQTLVRVQDLHSITPAELMEISSGVVHALSYQQARNYNLPCGGVYMAQCGYMFGRAGITCHCIFVSVGPYATPDLDSFENAFTNFHHNDRTTVKYFGLSDRHRIRTGIITVDRNWFPITRSVRDDATGLWKVRLCKDPLPKPEPGSEPVLQESVVEVNMDTLSEARLNDPPEPPGSWASMTEEITQASGTLIQTPADSATPISEVGKVVEESTVSADSCLKSASSLSSLGTTPLPVGKRQILNGLPPMKTTSSMQSLQPPLTPTSQQDIDSSRLMVARANLVLVAFDIPYMVDGIACSSYLGVGLIVDSKAGLILVDRNTVPMALGDVLVTFGGSQEVTGRVVFCHPVHNFSLVKFNPEEVDQHFTEAVFSDEYIDVGDTVNFHGLTSSFIPVYQKPVVTKVERLRLRDAKPPQFTAYNVEVVHFDKVASCVGGVFTDNQHRVVANWFSFAYTEEGERKEIFRGLHSCIVRRVLSRIEGHILALPDLPLVAADNLEKLELRSLGVQLTIVELSKVRAGMGLPPDWCHRFVEHCPEGRRQLLLVRRRAVSGLASPLLETGDIILAINGALITRFFEVEAATELSPMVEVTVLRMEKVVVLQVPTVPVPVLGTCRVVMWCGVMLQEPHLPVLALGFIPEQGGGVYASRSCYGSPAHKFGLRATVWVVEVNGTPTPTLNVFLDVVKSLSNNTAVRIKTVDLTTKVKVFTLKTDYHYWPTLEICREGTKWVHKSYNYDGQNSNTDEPR